MGYSENGRPSGNLPEPTPGPIVKSARRNPRGRTVLATCNDDLPTVQALLGQRPPQAHLHLPASVRAPSPGGRNPARHSSSICLRSWGHRDLLVTHKISPPSPDGHYLYPRVASAARAASFKPSFLPLGRRPQVAGGPILRDAHFTAAIAEPCRNRVGALHSQVASGDPGRLLGPYPGVSGQATCRQEQNCIGRRAFELRTKVSCAGAS